MKLKKIVCLLLFMLVLTGCSSPFEKKYDSATELFTDFNEVKEGKFEFAATFEIKQGDISVVTKISTEGVTDGKVAVCSYSTDFKCTEKALTNSITEPVVYIESAAEIRSFLMYALLDACGSDWSFSDSHMYACGSDDNSVVGAYFSYLAACVKKAGSNELADYIEAFAQKIRQEETRSVMNTKVFFDGKDFNETINGSIVMDETTLDFSTDYSFCKEVADYNSDSDYVTMETALEESFNDSYKQYGAQAGIYEEEVQEITSHVIDGSSLIVQGFDSAFYKFTWDGYSFNYSDGNLDYGMWTLSLTGHENTSVRFQLFLNSAEGLIQWYHDTYGNIMTVTDETEVIEAGIGNVVHSVVTYLDNGNEHVNEMYLYQISEEFLVQISVENSTNEYTEQELLDMALVSCTLYRGE